jgi:hypothetical protein
MKVSFTAACAGLTCRVHPQAAGVAAISGVAIPCGTLPMSPGACVRAGSLRVRLHPVASRAALPEVRASVLATASLTSPRDPPMM